MGLPLAHNAAPIQFYLLHSASQIGSELSDQLKKWVKGANYHVPGTVFMTCSYSGPILSNEPS